MNRKNYMAAIWLIGLGILFLIDRIWPGILILIGLSMLVGVLFPQEAKSAAPAAPPEKSAVPVPPVDIVEGQTVETAHEETLPPTLAGEGNRLYFASRLPEKCPACDAPMKINAEKMEFNDDQSTNCIFCGYRLEL